MLDNYLTINIMKNLYSENYNFNDDNFDIYDSYSSYDNYEDSIYGGGGDNEKEKKRK